MENREGEGDEASGDRRIVPGYDNEELFEYCFDQLMNGTRDDRREVVDYLVDEFDEMSLWMVEGFTEFANRDAPQDHQQVGQDDQNEVSTSNPTRKSSRLVKKRSSKVTNQQDDATERKDNQAKRDGREYRRKRRQQLKKNSVEYAKVLKGSQDYQKRRMARMTDKEKEKFIERRRNYYHNLSLEKKTKLLERGNEWRRQKRLESEEYREKERAYGQKYRAKMTEQQKAKKLAKQRERRQRKRQNMTENEPEKCSGSKNAAKCIEN